METHSLVLLSGSALDHTHIHNATTRRPQPLPVHRPPRRPFRTFAQGLARLLPQLKQLSQRLRRAPAPAKADVTTCVRTWPATSETDSSLADEQPCSTSHVTEAPPVRQPRWRPRRAQRVRAQDPRLVLGYRQQELQVQQHHQLLLQQREEQGDLLRNDLACADEPQQLALQVPVESLPATQPLRRGPLRRLARALHAVGAQMRPTGPGEHDKNVPDRVLNVATCGMFFQAGGKIVRLCRSLAARRFGWAFMAVGVIATIYHGSWGRFRNLARKVDYYSIAWSSLMLRAAVVGSAPRWVAAAMLAAIPFKPSLVSTSNFMAVEVRYLLLALSHRPLLAEWAAHTGLSVAATACFTLEHTPLLSWFPYTHAAFHALSAAAFLTLPSALNHITESVQAAA